jgi:hypothetical protein
MMFGMLLLYFTASIAFGFRSGLNALALEDGVRLPHRLALLHTGAKRLAEDVAECAISDSCDQNLLNITNLSVRVANDFSFLLLHHEVYSLLGEAAESLSPNSKLRAKIEHVMSVLSFSQGHVDVARALW